MVHISPKSYYTNLFFSIKSLNISSLSLPEVGYFSLLIMQYLTPDSEFALDCGVQMDLYCKESEYFFSDDRRFVDLGEKIVFRGEPITEDELNRCNSGYYEKTLRGLKAARENYTLWLNERRAEIEPIVAA